MNKLTRVTALLAIIGPLTACAGQDVAGGSLFAADATAPIDIAGANALARLWTAAGLPDDDNRAFILAIDPAGTVKAATVKLPTGNSGVLTYGDREKGGCRSVDMEAEFKGQDGKIRRGERVTAALCPPGLFGSWSATSVTETAQAQIVVPTTAALAPATRRPPKNPAANRTTRNGDNPGTPQNAGSASAPADAPSAPSDAAGPTADQPANAPEKAIAASPPPPGAAAPAPAPPAPAPAPKAAPAPWKPAIQTDL